MKAARKEGSDLLKHFGMRKTFVDLKTVSSYNSLYNAFHRYIRNGKSERKDVVAYWDNLKDNLKRLSKELLDETWRPDPGRMHKILSENKWRDIWKYKEKRHARSK